MNSTYIVSTGGQSYAVTAPSYQDAIFKAMPLLWTEDASLGSIVMARLEEHPDNHEDNLFMFTPLALLEGGCINKQECDEMTDELGV